MIGTGSFELPDGIKDSRGSARNVRNRGQGMATGGDVYLWKFFSLVNRHISHLVHRQHGHDLF